MSWINPNSLQRVREQLALRPDEVEKAASKLVRAHYAPVTVQQLEAWEHGRTLPELEHLETLSEIYGCPLGYFFLDNVPERTLPLSFRGLAPDKENHFSPQTRKTLQRFLELAEWMTALIEEERLPWEVKVKRSGGGRVELETIVGEERRRFGFGERVRQSWERADDGFAWWRRRVEDQGIFCFEMRLDPKDIRGASIWMKQRYPFILINHQDAETATGRLFTLLHEYAHLLLAEEGIVCDFRGREPREGIEPMANRFAAEMLLSLKVFEQHLKQTRVYTFNEQWPDSALDRLREPFFVSRDVVCIRLAELELAPADFYQRKREEWDQKYAGRPAWGRARPLSKKERKAIELGSAALRAFVALREKGTLPVLESAYLFDMKVEKVEEFLEWSRTTVAARQ